MHKFDLNRVEFYSKDDMASGQHLIKAEHILRAEIQSSNNDINKILEFYNIKKYIDSGLFLRSWSQEDIDIFKQKVTQYGKVIGQFMATINDSNVAKLYNIILRGYIHSFWELVNNHSVYKRVSKSNFIAILENEPYIISEILTHKDIVEYYDTEIKSFLVTYSQSAEILLSIYEVQQDASKKQKLLPKSLSLEDKENIISNYLDLSDVNYNYIGLIKNVKNTKDFNVSDKTRLKAKRLHSNETEKFFAEKGGMKYGVTINFPKNVAYIKEGYIDEKLIAHYSYSLDYIKQNTDIYILFSNFKFLFEYVDICNRINLVSKISQMGTLEKIIGIQSQNEYKIGTAFSLSEMTSYTQIYGYNKILSDLNISLESILHFIFTSSFQEKYDFATNARFSIPSSTNSNTEKVKLLASEFESILKQYKLFVEDGSIDFELLEISSIPSKIQNIPSLNPNKYIYFNEANKKILGCSNIFFSDQSHLSYVEQFKEKKYRTFFELLVNEQVKFSYYEEYQKTGLQYLIENGFIIIDSNDYLQITNRERIFILKDLYDNEFASFYRYSLGLQEEAKQMAIEKIITFDSSLFSKTEQDYFRYFLDKSKFTNGLDLRNRYSHGTQANPEEIKKHEYAYFTYLKLFFLVMLKIDDDLSISKTSKQVA